MPLLGHLPLGPQLWTLRHGLSGPPCKGRDVPGGRAGCWACTFSAPQTLFFKSQFLPTKHFRVLSQLKYKNKDTSEFSKHTLREKAVFQLSKKSDESFWCSNTAKQNLATTFPWVLFYDWDQAPKFFHVKGFFFLSRKNWKKMNKRAKQESVPNHGSGSC